MKTGIENIIAPLVNRFLGDYIEGLDANNLNIGILGGDVNLQNLSIKESALDGLDLPIRLKFGHVKRIVLKVPWHHIYVQPTKIEIEGVYLILVPNQGIEYDEEKAKKDEQETKQSSLKRLEQMRDDKRKPKEEYSDSFTERLISQVIKNLQITIKDVHLCYEDRYSNRKRQFSTGITIECLQLETTDSDFERTVHKEMTTLFYKLVSLKNFSLYLNQNKELLSDLKDPSAIISNLNDTIARDNHVPDFNYILQPLTITAKLRLNQRPESDKDKFSIPKIDLHFDLKSLVLSLQQRQYQDILLFLEAQERFNLAGKYLKYRPKNIFSYRGNYKKWWHYANNCVLVDIRRRQLNKRNMSWEKISQHRKRVKSYKEAWINKRTLKTPRHNDLETITKAENVLDLFNLNIARQLAEFEIDRKKLTRVEDQPAEGWVSWAGSWFGGKSAAATEQTGIIEKFEAAIDDEEKNKLYEAIGYQEDMPKTNYPKEFVENILVVNVNALNLILDNFVQVNFNLLDVGIKQRPSANGLSFTTTVDSVQMMGYDQPLIEMLDPSNKWLDFSLQLKPVDDPATDQSIKLRMAPVLMKYSASAVNRIVNVFKPPESVKLHQLMTMAFARYEQIKEQSVIGMKYFIDSKPKLEFDIEIGPSIFAVCQGGEFSHSKSTLLLQHGTFSFRTEENAPKEAFELVSDIRPKDKKWELIEKSYTNFEMNLEGVKLILGREFEKCMESAGMESSNSHLIEPTSMRINALQGLIDDINLTRFCVFGSLPNIVLKLSADKIIALIDLLNSIPLPQFEDDEPQKFPIESPLTKANIRNRAKMRAIMEVNEIEDEVLADHILTAPGDDDESRSGSPSSETKSVDHTREHQKQLSLRINLAKIGLVISKEGLGKFFDANIERMTVNMEKRMFDMNVRAHLGSLTVRMHQADGSSIMLIDNATVDGAHLIDVVYKQADVQSPYYETDFRPNDQLLDIVFQILNFNLHKNALADLKLFADNLQKRLAEIQRKALLASDARQRRQSAAQGQRMLSSAAEEIARKSSLSLMPGASFRRRSRSRDSSLNTLATPLAITPIPSNKYGERRETLQEFKPSKRFSFRFRMNKIAAILFAKLSEIKGGVISNSNVDENANAAFGALDITSLLVDGYMVDDGRLKADVTLENLTMEDRRQGVQTSKLMDKRHDPSSLTIDHFISLRYDQDAENRRIDISISRFYLILAPEFLGVLVGLFSFLSATEDSEDQSNIPSISTSSLPKTKQLQTPSTADNASLAALPVAQAVVEAPPKIELNCNLSEIEVILLENSLKPDDSQALIMSFNAFAKGITKDDVFKLKGALKDLQVTSTYFNHEKRHLSSYRVLQKFNVELTGSMNQITNAQNFDVTPENVYIALSPAVVRLMSAVSAQFSEHQGKLNVKPVEVALKRYVDYWNSKQIEKDQYWWFSDAELLKLSPAEEVIPEDETTDVVRFNPANAEVADQRLIVREFDFRVEINTDESSKPMVQLESSFGADVLNWSKSLSATAFMKLKASYYNQQYRIWEPLIEPVFHPETESEDKWKSWQLNLSANASDNIKLPKMSVSITSDEPLELTVTKGFIELSNQISESFQRAAKQIAPPKSLYQLPGTGPYVVVNQLDIPLSLTRSNILNVENGISCKQGEPVDLSIRQTHRRTSSGLSEQRNVEITVALLDTERDINISRVQKHCVPLPKIADSGFQWILLTDIISEHSRYLVTLRSLVSIVNRYDQPVQVYIENDNNPEEKILCAVIDPGKTHNVPMANLYTASGNFLFKPVHQNHPCEISNEAISWHSLAEQKRSFVCCNLSGDFKNATYMEIVAVEEEISRSVAGGISASAWTIYLFPPICIINLLPIPINIIRPVVIEVREGCGTELNLIAGLLIEFSLFYDAKIFQISMKIPNVNERETLQMIRLTCDDHGEELLLGINWSTENLRTELVIYAPYWMVNKTGRMLEYKEHLSERKFRSPCRLFRRQNQARKVAKAARHEPMNNPLILPLIGKDFFGKKKALVRIADETDFSTEFPLDTAGTVGRVSCASNDGTRDYEFSIEISLSQSGLTKIVTISPFYLIQNDSNFPLEISEEGNNLWTLVPAENVVGFWPVKSAKQRMMARFPNTAEESVPFPYGVQFEGFAKIENELIGVHVLSSISESSAVIHVEPFSPGMVPAIMMNATMHPVIYKQKDGEETTLNPGKMMPFAWDSLLKGRLLELEWRSGAHEALNKLVNDEFGQYMPSNTEDYHHWISFLSGKQRYFLFTDDEDVIKSVRKFENERFNTSVDLSIRAIGLSLVDNSDGYEILYMSLSSSLASWQVWEKSYCSGQYLKTLSTKLTETLEQEYQNYLKSEPENRVSAVKVDDDLEVDFSAMTLTKTSNRKRKPKGLQRTHRGLQLIYKQSDHQFSLQLEVPHLQIDNQLPTRIFPCMLSITPLPKSLVANDVPKPFIAFTLIMRQAEHSSVPQIQYLHTVVQEFAISVDTVLINAILRLFAKESLLPSYSKIAFDKDIENIRTSLNEIAVKTSHSQARTYYEFMHIGPLMIHLSFAQGVQDPKHKSLTTLDIQWGFLDLLFKSVGLTMTEIQDACFKMQPFNRRAMFYNNEQLNAEIQSHYQIQVIKQLYKLALGLDILGNPYGIVTDLFGGVTDLFYHPIQGLVLGPEEFVSGLAMGVESVLSATVGGAFNVASRIGGTVGKGIAVLTFDDDYQRQRLLQQSSQRPTDITQGLARGFHGVIQGVVEGGSGVVRRPLEGAQEGGVGGFMKGIGKGVIGAIARPVAGVVDATTGTLDSVKNTLRIGPKEVSSLRPPRIITADKIIKPYVLEDAIGNNILKETDSGQFSGDVFVAYGSITKDCVLIVTDKRVILSKRGDVIGKWSNDWALSYDEIKPPELIERGVKFEYKQSKKGFLGFGNTKGKAVQFSNPVTARRVVDSMFQAYNTRVA